MTTTHRTITDTVVVFPAEVTLPDGRNIHPAKVAVTPQRTVVWGETRRPDGGKAATVAFAQQTYGVAEAMDAAAPRRSQRMRVATDAGEIIIVRAGGCGCGSPLRRVDPATELGLDPS